MSALFRGALAGLLLALLLAGGCAKTNAVKLTYALGNPPAPFGGEVTVFKFADKRPGTRLGTARDGSPVTALSDVADWVGWALFDELKAAGCDPKYRTSTATPGDAPVVTGEVLAAELNQTGTTTWAGKVSVRISIQRGGQVVHSEKFTSEVEDVAVPGYGNESDIMAEALRGLMAEVVPVVGAVLTGGK
jgi:hypothetical protein